MSPMLLVIGATSVATSALVVLLAPRRGALEHTRRFQRQHRLPDLPAEAEAAVAQVQRRSALVPAMVAATIGVVLVLAGLVVPRGTWEQLGSWSTVALFLPIIVSVSVTMGVVSARTAVFRPDPEAPRVARLRTVTARDLLGRLVPLVSVFRVVAIVSVAVTVVVTLVRGTIVGAVLAAGVAVVAAAVDLGNAALERQVLARPQPAASVAELQWDEALRGETIGLLRQAREQVLLLAAVGAPGLALAMSGDAYWFAIGASIGSFGFAAAMVVQLVHVLAASRRTAVVA